MPHVLCLTTVLVPVGIDVERLVVQIFPLFQNPVRVVTVRSTSRRPVSRHMGVWVAGFLWVQGVRPMVVLDVPRVVPVRVKVLALVVECQVALTKLTKDLLFVVDRALHLAIHGRRIAAR